MDIRDVGTILYWCEGSKRERDRRIEFVNSDPKMISIFMKYLRTKGIDEERIRIRMLIHPQDNEAACRKYWKTVTSLKDSNFISSLLRKSSMVKKPLPYGFVTIRYNSVELLREVNGDISELIRRIS